MSDVEIVVEHGTGLVDHSSWDEFVDGAGTIFHTSRFLLPWWHDTQAKLPESQLMTTKVVDGGEVIGVCAFELHDGLLSFAGGRNVVDYMGPVAAEGREDEVAAALTQWIFEGPE